VKTAKHWALQHKAQHSVLGKVELMFSQRAEVLINGDQEVGHREVKFDGSNLASGVYFYRLTAGDFVQTKRLTLLK
jgi:hypothetical protein